ncbi:hypothetical protein H9Y04_15895 [Streptomyces sp. TRM66268-LWL]|uniref:Uncharacterized protein n=1 Tax=Streptomyces polyasparticus TaxID=2767826 RepID=A0ABR7SGD4_9ACTN|nr:hypothetical protein [Streptomyces polyasparticus]MBC9714047.1 hypothetical protein [Streptomyces polyasparticus]
MHVNHRRQPDETRPVPIGVAALYRITTGITRRRKAPLIIGAALATIAVALPTGAYVTRTVRARIDAHNLKITMAAYMLGERDALARLTASHTDTAAHLTARTMGK